MHACVPSLHDDMLSAPCKSCSPGMRGNESAKKNADVRNKAKKSIHSPCTKNSFTHVKQIHASHVIAWQACHANKLHAIHANKLASSQPIARNRTIHAPFTISTCIGERKKAL